MEEGFLLKEREEKKESLSWKLLRKEVKKLGYLAGPLVVVALSEYLLQSISLMMVGHLGELELSSSAIAFSLCGVTGFSFLVSLISLGYFFLKFFVIVFSESLIFCNNSG